MRCERGQASIEWVGLVLLASLALGALATAVPVIDGRSFGGFLSYRIVCAVRGHCDAGDGALNRAYGPGDARRARELAPNIVYEPGGPSVPVDFRRCRAHACADAPDDRDLDVHRSSAGSPATVFVRRLRRGGRLYLQYWFYYPDSNSTIGSSDKIWRYGLPVLEGRPGAVLDKHTYPGYHDDDWEGYQVRRDPDGSVWVRATAHGHYQWCKQRSCHNRWGRRTGWTRVSRGSHAGHIPLDRIRRYLVRRRGFPGVPWIHTRDRYRARIPGRNLRERTTTAEGIRLVPLETLSTGGYRRLGKDVKPPWEKGVYADPEAPRS
jgi:hypothetical protein